jgi:LAO/AO transport system kinase
MSDGGDGTAALAEDVLAGDQGALASAITAIENRAPGHRELVARLHRAAGDAAVLGVTGSPGAGKSTLVRRLVAAYRDREERVGVIAVDPSSPFSGGAVLGDRVRMSGELADPGVFVRSMSARGSLGGLATATTDAVTALDAFGADRVIVETVGAGQNEVEVVSAADTVAVLVPPGSGDDVQMLKAGLLEVADVFVVNKADLDGADRTAMELEAMLEIDDDSGWRPPVVETVATESEGVETLVSAVDDHRDHLGPAGLADRRQTRYAGEIRALLRAELRALVEEELDGDLDELAERVADRETDPHTVVASLLDGLPAAADNA